MSSIIGAGDASLPVLSSSELHKRLSTLVPQKVEELKQVLEQVGEVPVSSSPVTISQVLGGARDVACLYWETSILDAREGIRMRGRTIPQLKRELPTSSSSLPSSPVASSSSTPTTTTPTPTSREPLPEGLLWLLLTNEIPTPTQTRIFGQELASRAASIPKSIFTTIASFPRDMHPMTQFASAILSLQPHSKFAKSYAEGKVRKTQLWISALEDVLDLISRLPVIAGAIYQHSFFPHVNVASPDTIRARFTPNPALDYSANFAHFLGFSKPSASSSFIVNDSFAEALRLYVTIHADHEGGNVSAHTTRVVSSALADPYLSFCASMCGLAGPLHGRANQEVMMWILNLQKEFQQAGKPVNKVTIAEYAWSTLKSGRVIPGYGHSVLRVTDPRYIAQREFCQKHMPNDPLFQIVSTIFEVVPDVLTQHGKTRNPWPNVDAASGVLLHHFGLTQFSFYTVLFGVSRAFGVLSQLFWDRALGLPLERPKSLDLNEILKIAKKARKEEASDIARSTQGNVGVVDRTKGIGISASLRAKL